MRVMNRILFAPSFGVPLTLGALGKLPLLPPRRRHWTDVTLYVTRVRATINKTHASETPSVSKARPKCFAKCTRPVLAHTRSHQLSAIYVVKYELVYLVVNQMVVVLFNLYDMLERHCHHFQCP